MDRKEALKVIKNDLSKLDKAWDILEDILQDELTKYFKDIPYDILNDIKIGVLVRFEEWLGNYGRYKESNS